MATTTKRRKPRSDRNHIIYKIICTYTQEAYIGVCIVRKQARVKSLKQRWKQHIRASTVECKQWKMSQAIREHGTDAFRKEIIEVVRGKATAYDREAELINSLRPQLNTKIRAI